jgi:ubiquinone biosynthesis protein UbiJ
MLQHPAVFALNHLIKAEAWARDGLKTFAGQCVEFRARPMPDLRLKILDSGLLEGAAQGGEANLLVTIKPGALPALAFGKDALLREIDIEGNAELAAMVQQLFRNLRWDLEEDLSRVFGDSVAHRMVENGGRIAAWNREAVERLAQSFAEYWTEEQPLLARPAEVRQFNAEVERLRDELARLEKRIETLAGPN